MECIQIMIFSLFSDINYSLFCNFEKEIWIFNFIIKKYINATDIVWWQCTSNLCEVGWMRLVFNMHKYLVSFNIVYFTQTTGFKLGSCWFQVLTQVFIHDRGCALIFILKSVLCVAHLNWLKVEFSSTPFGACSKTKTNSELVLLHFHSDASLHTVERWLFFHFLLYMTIRRHFNLWPRLI